MMICIIALQRVKVYMNACAQLRTHTRKHTRAHPNEMTHTHAHRHKHSYTYIDLWGSPLFSPILCTPQGRLLMFCVPHKADYLCSLYPTRQTTYVLCTPQGRLLMFSVPHKADYLCSMYPTSLTEFAIYYVVQWNLVTKRSDITKPSYNKVILLVPALYISLFCTLI